MLVLSTLVIVNGIIPFEGMSGYFYIIMPYLIEEFVLANSFSSFLLIISCTMLRIVEREPLGFSIYLFKSSINIAPSIIYYEFCSFNSLSVSPDLGREVASGMLVYTGISNT